MGRREEVKMERGWYTAMGRRMWEEGKKCKGREGGTELWEEGREGRNKWKGR
jgi:hypothetical protein